PSRGTNPASRRGSPIYSATPLTPCRCPYSGGPSDCLRRCLHRWFCLRHSVIGSATTWPTNPEPVGRLTKLQHSRYGAAWSLACPAPVRTFTTELAWAGSPTDPSRL